jgi:hypothetical protein
MPRAGNNKRMRRLGRITSYFLLAAQMLSIGHLVLVRHSTCAEHGDVIHGPAGEPHEGRFAESLSSSDGTVAGTVPQAEGGHDHCLICTTTRERFALTPPVRTSVDQVGPSVSLVSPSHTGAMAPVAVLVFSPKNSPPAV